MVLTGASDCAACVGIQIEMARAMLADTNLELPAPVVFAFNGGEETLSQAAHGYMAQSEFAAELGAFINIESTGPGGPDILFQHTGVCLTPHKRLLADLLLRGCTVHVQVACMLRHRLFGVKLTPCQGGFAIPRRQVCIQAVPQRLARLWADLVDVIGGSGLQSSSGKIVKTVLGAACVQQQPTTIQCSHLSPMHNP